MFKKLAATGILGFALAGSALAATPAYAAAQDGGDRHHGKHGHHHGKHGHHHGKHHGHHHGKHGHHFKFEDRHDKHGSFSNNHTGGNFSILGGNQVFAPISVPVNVCGNSLAVFGISSAKCKGGASVDF